MSHRAPMTEHPASTSRSRFLHAGHPIPAPQESRWLGRVALSQRPWSIFASIGVLISFLGNATVPVIVGKTVDNAITPGDPQALLLWLGALVAVLVGGTACMLLARLLMERSLLNIGHNLRMAVTDRIADPRGIRPPDVPADAQPGGAAPTQAKDFSPGALLSIASSDTQRVSMIVMLTIFPVAEIGSLLYVSVMIILLHPILGIAVLLGGPIVVFVALRAARPLRVRDARSQAALAATAALATDVVHGLRVLKGLGAVGSVRRRYEQVSQHSYAAMVVRDKAQARLTMVTEFAGGVYVAAVGLAAGLMALHGALTVGELIAVVGLTQFIITPMTMLGRNIASMLASASASAERVKRVLGAPYRWDSLEHRTAELVSDAIPTGLTVIPAEFGAELAGISPPWDPQFVIVPPHEAELFDGTVQDNVHPDAAIATWALDVAASTDIPGGPQKRVGESGSMLSGGQRQRVALARAIAAQPALLVLREPTTAVDSVTEARIVERIHAARAAAKTVVISSSPAWRAAADQTGDGATVQQLQRLITDLERAGHPAGAAPSGHPAGAAPSGHPAGAAPSGHPARAAQDGHPKGAAQ